ncbi:MAG: hypothetical protein M5U01_38295 [Ardenticatenaceae bacterium]|nr:hypothetical protein [Ardenticatenaceae bacterium]HBY97631.1 hypothetical protein [Chloroflexota bacterium]
MRSSVPTGESDRQERVTRHTVRRIAPGSAIRLGCVLGWLIVLLPALCLAWLAVRALSQLDRTLERIEPIRLTILGQEIARIDLLATLRLQATAQTVNRLVEILPVTFILLTVLLVLAGALILVVVTLLGSIGYNLLAARGWGLEVDLREKG